MKKVLQGLICLAAIFLVGSPASAATLTLNQSACCGVGPFGTVALSQFDLDTVDVLVTLNPGIGFVDTGTDAPGNHPDFAFNLVGSPSGVTVDFIQQGGDNWRFYDVHAAPISMSDSFGTYQFALYCNGAIACAPGASHPNFGPLEFHVNLAGITVNSFVANAAGSVFVADIINGAPNGNGKTGLVRTTDRPVTVNVVPEPTTLTLLGIGLIGAARRARRKLPV